MDEELDSIIEEIKSSGIIDEYQAKELTPELIKKLAPYITYTVEGLREEKYIGQVFDGHKCNFEYYDT